MTRLRQGLGLVSGRRSAEVWVRMQAAYDLSQAMEKEGEIRVSRVFAADVA